MIYLYVINSLSVVTVFVLLFLYLREKRVKTFEHYTDYRRGSIVFRIYKPEFEFQAIGNIKRGRLLDTGQLNPFYNWALIEDKI